jgi:hypothetical protein
LALDIVLLDDNDNSKGGVALGVADHGILMSAAWDLGLSCIRRMDDYYGECEFAQEELNDYLSDVKALQKVVTRTHPHLRETLAQMESMGHDAKRLGLHIGVLPD